MVDKEDLLKQAEDIHSGLKRLSLKNRKVVMPHHKEFELIEYLFNESNKIICILYPKPPYICFLKALSYLVLKVLACVLCHSYHYSFIIAI